MADSNQEHKPIFGVGRFKVDERELASILIVVLVVQSVSLSYWIYRGPWPYVIVQVLAVLPFLAALYYLKVASRRPRT